jgi:hypothetical protein
MPIAEGCAVRELDDPPLDFHTRSDSTPSAMVVIAQAIYWI